MIRLKHPIVGDFIEYMTKNGYEKTWEKFMDKIDNEKYDFNDISEISEWIQDSVTNNNHYSDEPPYYVLNLVKSLIINNK